MDNQKDFLLKDAIDKYSKVLPDDAIYKYIKVSIPSLLFSLLFFAFSFYIAKGSIILGLLNIKNLLLIVSVLYLTINVAIKIRVVIKIKECLKVKEKDINFMGSMNYDELAYYYNLILKQDMFDTASESLEKILGNSYKIITK